MGDEKDVVGVGYGKANEVPVAIQKGVEQAKKNLIRVPKHGQTITHSVTGVFGSSRVFLKPATLKGTAQAAVLLADAIAARQRICIVADVSGCVGRWSGAAAW